MNHNHTVRCCLVGYIVQAIVNFFLPLLFLTGMLLYLRERKRNTESE